MSRRSTVAGGRFFVLALTDRRSGCNFRDVTTTGDDAKGATMLRANVSKEQIKALRLMAVEEDTTMQQLVGDLIQDYLERNGYKTKVAQ